MSLAEFKTSCAILKQAVTDLRGNGKTLFN